MYVILLYNELYKTFFYVGKSEPRLGLKPVPKALRFETVAGSMQTASLL